MRHYSRDDVQMHSNRPAVNVKVYRNVDDAWKEFERDEPEHDPRFTLEWIEEHVSDDHAGDVFWSACENEFEYFAAFATTDDDAIFPASRYGRLTVEREGRQGGWAVVGGLPEIEEWDAVLLARWRRFERIAREIADGIPLQMIGSLYINEFEVWADEQDDAATYNAEAPVDQALAE